MTALFVLFTSVTMTNKFVTHLIMWNVFVVQYCYLLYCSVSVPWTEIFISRLHRLIQFGEPSLKNSSFNQLL